MDEGKIEAQLNLLHMKFDALIRLEEKHNSLANRVDGNSDRIHKHANMLMGLQQENSLNAKSVKQFEKLIYMLVGSVFAAVAYFVFERIAH